MRLKFLDNGYVLMVVTAVLWSANSTIGRGVHGAVPPIGLAFWRFLVALPIFAALAWPVKRWVMSTNLRVERSSCDK